MTDGINGADIQDFDKSPYRTKWKGRWGTWTYSSWRGWNFEPDKKQKTKRIKK